MTLSTNTKPYKKILCVRDINTNSSNNKLKFNCVLLIVWKGVVNVVNNKDWLANHSGSTDEFNIKNKYVPITKNSIAQNKLEALRQKRWFEVTYLLKKETLVRKIKILNNQYAKRNNKIWKKICFDKKPKVVNTINKLNTPKSSNPEINIQGGRDSNSWRKFWRLLFYP